MSKQKRNSLLSMSNKSRPVDALFSGGPVSNTDTPVPSLQPEEAQPVPVTSQNSSAAQPRQSRRRATATASTQNSRSPFHLPEPELPLAKVVFFITDDQNKWLDDISTKMGYNNRSKLLRYLLDYCKRQAEAYEANSDE